MLLISFFRKFSMEVCSTRGQVSNPVWHELREGLITASRMGKILKILSPFKDYVSRTGITVNDLKDHEKCQQRMQRIMYPGPRTGPPRANALAYGIENEQCAMSCYKDWLAEKHPDMKVTTKGLFVDRQYSWLACSPDGIVSPSIDEDSPTIPPESILLEIKCPYSLRQRDSKTIEQKAMEYGWYLKMGRKVNGKQRLLMNLDNAQGFDYWHQVQSSMHILDIKVCHFVVWQRYRGIQVVVIERDPSWRNLYIPRLLYAMEHVMVCTII